MLAIAGSGLLHEQVTVVVTRPESVVMIASNSIGVNQPSADWRRRRGCEPPPRWPRLMAPQGGRTPHPDRASPPPRLCCARRFSAAHLPTREPDSGVGLNGSTHVRSSASVRAAAIAAIEPLLVSA